MPTLNQVKEVIKKISSIDELGKHVCFFGGSIPYIVSNQESNREHSDIDVMVDEQYMLLVRSLLQEQGIYKPELDSLNLGMDGDYGLKAFINGVYVEFEPASFNESFITRRSFSTNRHLYGEEIVPFIDISDLISPINIDGIETFSQSLEFIKVGKEKYLRPKDIVDIEIIDKIGIDEEKYQRAKASFEQSTINMQEYNHDKTL